MSEAEAFWCLTGGPLHDATALILECDPDGCLGISWFGDWTGAAPTSIGQRLHPRWGARLATPPPSLLLPGAGGAYSDAPGLELLRADGRWAFLPTTVRVVADPVRNALIVEQTDAQTEVSLATRLELDRDSGVLRMASTVTNLGADSLGLLWCASAMLTVPFWVDHLLDHAGDWCAEFRREQLRLGESSLVREARSGRGGHARFPGMILTEGRAQPDRGRVLGVQLAWSGDHRGRVDRSADGDRALQIGVLPGPGELTLAAGGQWRSPAAHVAVTSCGLDGLAERFTAEARRHVVPAVGQRWPRPVHLNTWEAVYFDHDRERLLALAEAAARVGVERFVLDDGWFEGRTNDRRALGDWQPDCVRYPDGLAPLANHVTALGMEFGLWVEPEMVSEDSDLFRAHPDWVRGLPGRTPILGRQQRVLDLTQTEVVDHLFGVLDGLLAAYPIGYLKWDHNRALTEAAADGTAGHLKQVEGVYRLIDRLRSAHPEVEIESCASGGGRMDWGMLARCHRVWTSDSNDPVVRARIMAGAGLFLPPETLGVHIGPERAHTTGRRTRLEFRAAVALLGHFGLELDLLALDEDELHRVAGYVTRYRRWRTLLHSGRHATPVFDADHLVRVVTATDGSEALVIALRLDDREPGRPVHVRLTDLHPECDYQVVCTEPLPRPGQVLPDHLRPPGSVMSGAWLMHAGLTLQLPTPQSAAVIAVQRTDGEMA